MSASHRTIPLADLDLARYVRPGDGVVWGQGPGAPLGLVTTLLAQRERFGPVSAFCGYTAGLDLRPEHADAISFTALGAFGDLRHLARAGALRIIPAHMSDLAGLLADGTIPADVVLVQVSPADDEGWHSLGVAVQHLPEAIAQARCVIAEINDHMPRTFGYRLHGSRFDVAVEASRPIVELPARAPGAVARQIAGHVAALVPPDATLQLGVGSMPDAVLTFLAGRGDIGFHTGLLTDTVIDVIAAAPGGVLGQLPLVSGAVFGTRRLYEFVDGNFAVQIRSVGQTHDPAALRAIPRFVSINSALEVDLTGQVNAETLAGRMLGGVGGQVDFIRAANESPGGVAVIALASTSGPDARSTITARLCGPVTTARSDVRFVVTEYGAVDLHGLDLDRRAEALVGIADPGHRDALRAAIRAGDLDG
jgi:acyl-CoA hydrolase